MPGKDRNLIGYTVKYFLKEMQREEETAMVTVESNRAVICSCLRLRGIELPNLPELGSFLFLFL